MSTDPSDFPGRFQSIPWISGIKVESTFFSFMVMKYERWPQLKLLSLMGMAP